MMTIRRRPFHIRPAAILVAAVAVAASTYAGSWLADSGAWPNSATGPAAPAADLAAQVPVLGAGGQTADLDRIADQIEVWGAKAAADPYDYISATNLGILYLGRARLTGDTADYERATAAAERAIAADATYTPGRTLDALLLLATHDFGGALAAAQALAEEDPANVDALSVVADAQLELGRLEEAGVTYARLASMAPGPALDLRLARFAYLSGDAERALIVVQRAREAVLGDWLADRALYAAQVGEIARLTGDAGLARASFETALTIRSTDQLALVGLARVAAYEGDDAEAIGLLRESSAIAPRPETLALLGDLLARAGDQRGASDAYATVRLTEQLGGTAATLFDRQILLFELDHGTDDETLLARAIAAARTRPDAAGLDVAAWAAFRIGDLATAADYSARALADGTIDARILFHAGAITLGRGDDVTGQALLRKALDLGPALDPADRAEATALLSGA
jgi:tetratricopeptide (TPR) repeat protein